MTKLRWACRIRWEHDGSEPDLEEVSRFPRLMWFVFSFLLYVPDGEYRLPSGGRATVTSG